MTAVSTHGSTGYLNGCRCDICRHAKAVISRRSNARRARGERRATENVPMRVARATVGAIPQWTEHGHCTSEDPMLWDEPLQPYSRSELRRARLAIAICRTCPVISQCQEFAARDPKAAPYQLSGESGIFGGLVFRAGRVQPFPQERPR